MLDVLHNATSFSFFDVFGLGYFLDDFGGFLNFQKRAGQATCNLQR